jgi:ATP-dependent Zn protease
VAVRLLQTHRGSLDKLAAALLEKETLVRDEVVELLGDVQPESRAADTVGVPRVVASREPE